jgi:MFS family permease
MGDSESDAGGRLDEHAVEARRVESEPGLRRRLRRLPRNVFAISLVSLFNDASSEIIYPLLPLFLALTGATSAQIGLIEGAAESLSGFLKLFSGYFSDRRGRRKGMVVFGYGLASVARPLIGFATHWPQVFAIRMADRFGKGVRSAPRDAMIADAAAPAERGLAFGFHRAMDHAGAVIGPLIAYATLSVIAANRESPTLENYKTLFLLASVPALFAVLVAIFAVRETGHAARPNGGDAARATTPPPPHLTLRGFDSNFKRLLAVLALFTLSNSSDAFLLLRARQAGVSAALIPLLWAALHVSKVVSSVLGGDLSDRLGRKTMIVAGWALYAAVYLGFAFVSEPTEAWMLFLVYGIYFGLTEGTEKALVADLVRPEQRGTAYGLYNLAFSITVFPASLLMGALWDWRGAPTAFAASAALGSFAALMLALTVSTSAKAEARP